MTISHSIREIMQKGSWIRQMFEEGARLKALHGVENVFDFSLGNPILEPPQEVHIELINLLNNPQSGIHRYMPNAGFPETCEFFAGIMRHETGYPFVSEDEAISIANDTDYGLTNYIQTQDKEKVKRVARKLRSGMVDVNGVGIAVASPFGGYKHSGIGREAGTEGLIEFLEVKTVGGWN